MTKIECGILGATGTVGQRFVQLLEGHPTYEPVLLAASAKRKGGSYGDEVKWLMETPLPQYARQITLNDLDPDEIASTGIGVVFSALPSDIAGPIETALAERGIWVFSNAAAHRMDPHTPILIPEVNHSHIGIIDLQPTNGKIITNANCSTTGLVLGLAPLIDFGIERVFVTTYQALSGAGYPGVASSDIIGNVIPFIPGEEEKMVAETKRILGKVKYGIIEEHGMEVVASCARVPVLDGHLESVVVEFGNRISSDELEDAFSSFDCDQVRGLHSAPAKTLVFTRSEDRPQPRIDVWGSDATGMAVTVGRLSTRDRLARFFLLSHNTVRGAAGGSILNAELAYRKELLEVGK